MFDELVDEKSKLKSELEDTCKQLDDYRNDVKRADVEIENLVVENELLKDDNEKISNENDGLSEKNKDLKKEMKRLVIDLGKLKELLRRACDLEAQMKNVLGDSEDIVVKLANVDRSKLLADDDETHEGI